MDMDDLLVLFIMSISLIGTAVVIVSWLIWRGRKRK